MKFDEFVGRVQHRAKLGTEGETVRAIEATLTTLGERLAGGEAANLAAQLPEELGAYLRGAPEGESFDLDEFFNRVTIREGVDEPGAVYHARAVLSVLKEAVTPGEWADMRAQLPDEYEALLEAGAKGELDIPES
jgi:uncharacterized protein (DUF2267 family)